MRVLGVGVGVAVLVVVWVVVAITVIACWHRRVVAAASVTVAASVISAILLLLPQHPTPLQPIKEDMDTAHPTDDTGVGAYPALQDAAPLRRSARLQRGNEVIDHLFIPRVFIVLICGLASFVGFGAMIAHWTEPIQARPLKKVKAQ